MISNKKTNRTHLERKKKKTIKHRAINEFIFSSISSEDFEIGIEIVSKYVFV